MKRNTKAIALVAMLFAMASVVFAAASANYKNNPSVIDQGGRQTYSPGHKQQSSVGGAAVGNSASQNFRTHAGFIAQMPFIKDWLMITQPPMPHTIGLGGMSEFKWLCEHNGAVSIEIGGDGTPDSGFVLRSGPCVADREEAETIYESDLTDNAENDVFVIVTVASDTKFRKVTVIDDQLPPMITMTRVVINGTIDDDTVTEVIVNGMSFPVTDGAYSAEVSAGLDTIDIEATNGSGKTVYRTINIHD